MKKILPSLIVFLGLLLINNIIKANVYYSNQPTASDNTNTENSTFFDNPLSILIIDDDNYPAQPKKTAKKANSSVKKLSEKPIINDTIINQTARTVNYQLLDGEKYIKNT